MAAAWEERFGKLDRAAESLEKIVAHRQPQLQRRTASSRGCTSRRAGGRRWSRPTATTSWRRPTCRPRVDLYVAMGVGLRAEPQDIDRAIEAYTDVLSFDADEQRALDALGRLYEKISEWDRAIDMMAHLVQLTDDAAQAGRPVLAHGPDPVRPARRRRRRGGQPAPRPRHRPGHVPTMEALTKQYSDRGDWLKAAQMMVRAESYTPVAIDKVRLLFEAARIYQDKLRQDDAGQAAVRRGDRARPRARRGRPAARRALLRGRAVGRAVAGDRHAGAARSASSTPTRASSTSCTTAPRAPPTSSATTSKALGYYKAAYDIDSTYLPTLIGRADLLFKMAGLGRRREDLPDHPGPAPRRPGRGGRRPHLLPARHGSPGPG